MNIRNIRNTSKTRNKWFTDFIFSVRRVRRRNPTLARRIPFSNDSFSTNQDRIISISIYYELSQVTQTSTRKTHRMTTLYNSHSYSMVQRHINTTRRYFQNLYGILHNDQHKLEELCKNTSINGIDILCLVETKLN